MLRGVFFTGLLTILLAACAPSTQSPRSSAAFPENVTTTEPTYTGTSAMNPGGVVAADTLREPIRVAILVPQSGTNGALGQSILQAAQLAVFDLHENNFQLVPKDTGGTAEGARKAVDEAAREGARLILGPVFSNEVEAAKAAARNYGLTVIGFSTDWRVAGGNTFTMGVLPFGQAQRIAEFAAAKGLKRIAIIAPRDVYGDAVLQAFQTTAQRSGISSQAVVRIAPDGSDAATAVAQLTAGATNGAAFDGIFMPVGGNALHALASTLKSYGLGSDRVTYLGTGLWDDAGITSDANMTNAYYAAPSPQVRTAFERNYQRIYGSMPPRLASIGYDAAALAIVLARQGAISGAREAFDKNAITNPNGFSGVDGIFRFRSDGLAERGMAVLQIVHGGQIAIVDQAPSSFVSAAR
ncbi:MAG TPA: penicillin-binding protein activator [Alphaproteobacteria bacterium]